MMKILSCLMIASVSVLTSLASLSALAEDAYGQPFEGWGFVKDDWQLVCDNTLTCRAAGYDDESMSNTPASILLTVIPQKSIPNVQVAFEYQEEKASNSDNGLSTTELWLNNKNYGAIKKGELNAEQTQQLLSHSHQNTKIEIRVDADI